MPVLSTDEIFNIANNLSSKEEIASYLRGNSSKAVQELIRHNFEEDIKFLLPEGSPDFFDRDKPRADEATLNYEVRRLYLFVEGGHPTLTPLKRESLWIALLESLSANEADDLTHTKDKKLQEKYKNITHEVCHLAFPEFVRQPKPKLARDNKGRFSTKETKKPRKKKTEKK